MFRLDLLPALTVAGRTDAGVHARGAVAHLDVPERSWTAISGRSGLPPGEAAVRRLHGVLPADLTVFLVTPAPPGFDARFAAISRRYSYRLCDQPISLDPLRRWDTAVHPRRLDIEAMNRAAMTLVGLHDFGAFCRRREGASTVRTLLELHWSRDRDGVLLGRIVADAFCHSMVRSLVGVLVPVGEGRRDEAWPGTVLAAAKRDGSVRVMPAHGLCLEEVSYPAAGQLEARVRESRRRRELPPAIRQELDQI